MKTHSSARYLVRIRVMAIGVALAAIAAIEFGVSERLAAGIGQTTARLTDNSAAPNVSISDLMAAAR